MGLCFLFVAISHNQSHHSFSLLIYFIDLSTVLYQHEQSRPSSHSENTSGMKLNDQIRATSFSFKIRSHSGAQVGT